MPGPKSRNIVLASRFLIKEMMVLIFSELIFALPGLSPAPLTNLRLLMPVSRSKALGSVTFSVKKSWNPCAGFPIHSRACRFDDPKSVSIRMTFWPLKAIPAARLVQTTLLPIPPFPPPTAIMLTEGVIMFVI